MNEILYNVIMLAIVLGGLALLRQQPTWRWAVSTVIWLGAGMVLCALVLGDGGFGAMRLMAYGIFLYGALFCLCAAVMVWRTVRSLAGALLFCCVALIGVAIDAFWIEPTWLEVTRHEIGSSKLDKPLKIVVLADLQTDHIGDYEREVFVRIRDERPDMILCAGDYLQTRDRQRLEPKLARQLRTLLADLPFTAPLGVYLVEGNIDSNRWADSFEGLPVTLFHHTQTVDPPRSDLRITGLSMRDSFSENVSVAASERFHICLGHSPDFSLAQVEADLLVAGHVHGGQVRLPFLGPILTLSRVPRSWAVGLTRISKNRHLLVSRGVGMERNAAPRMRFLCRPELVVLNLVPSSSD